MWIKNENYTFPKCLFTALLIQHTMRMHLIVICSLTGPKLFFPYLFSKCTILDKMSRNVKYELSFPLHSLSRTFATLKSSERNVNKMHIGLHVKYPLFLSDCSETWIF